MTSRCTFGILLRAQCAVLKNGRINCSKISSELGAGSTAVNIVLMNSNMCNMGYRTKLLSSLLLIHSTMHNVFAPVGSC